MSIAFSENKVKTIEMSEFNAILSILQRKGINLYKDLHNILLILLKRSLEVFAC